MVHHHVHVILDMHCFAVCRAKDSEAQLATAWRLVQVQQVYSVTLSVPILVASQNLTTAIAQSDLFTSGDAAASSLTGALAAGLIAGGFPDVRL